MEGVDTRGSGGVTDGFADLATFLGTPTIPGFTIDPSLGDNGFFASSANAASFSLATITIEEVAPIPLPAGLPLMLAGLGAFGLIRRRAK